MRRLNSVLPIVVLIGVVPVLTLTGCLGPQPPTPISNAVTVPPSVNATCATDVTASLQAVLDQARTRTLRLAPGACYRVEQPLTIRDADGMTIEGNGAIIRRTESGPADGSARGWRIFFIQGGRNIVVRNLTIVGPHPQGGRRYDVDYEAQHAFWLDGAVRGFWLLGSRIRNIWGDNVYMAGRPPDIPDGVTIVGNQFDLAGRQGIACVSCRNLFIALNEIQRVGRTALDLEPGTDSGLIDGVYFADNDIVDARRFVGAQGANAPVRNVQILRNRLSQTPMHLGVFAPSWRDTSSPSKRQHFTIDRNISKTLPDGGHVVWIQGVDDLRLTNNTWRVREGTTDSPELANNHPQVVENNTVIIG